MQQAQGKNFSAYLLFKQSIAPQIPADATTINGTTFDRYALAMPQSCHLSTNYAYTTGSGAGGATQTVLIQLYSGNASNMSDETLLKQKSVVITWATDAAKVAAIQLPVDLSNAGRYIRGKFKTTKGGTVTITLTYVAQTMVLGGLQKQPATAFADAGYFESTDAAA